MGTGTCGCGLRAREVRNARVAPTPAGTRISSELRSLVSGRVVMSGVSLDDRKGLCCEAGTGNAVGMRIGPTTKLGMVNKCRVRGSAVVRMAPRGVGSRAGRNGNGACVMPTMVRSSVGSICTTVARRTNARRTPNPFCRFRGLVISTNMFCAGRSFTSFKRAMRTFGACRCAVCVPSGRTIHRTLTTKLPAVRTTRRFVLARRRGCSFSRSSCHSSVQGVVTSFIGCRVRSGSMCMNNNGAINGFRADALSTTANAFYHLNMANDGAKVVIRSNTNGARSISASSPTLCGVVAHSCLFSGGSLVSSGRVRASSFTIIRHVPGTLCRGGKRVRRCVGAMRHLRRRFSSGRW